jgi:asparagine synthase (glutamine-hydrolysing)
MCGIAGVVTDVREEGVDSTVARMLSEQEHRGPEGRKVVRIDHVVFGHCVLAYTDVGRSRQPYVWADGRCVLVFNGEIYNHRELRAELDGRGIPVEDAGEAAVLAALYATRGVEMVAALNGMFAIAIHDLEARQTLLIRDRFGKKPLFYHLARRRLTFASELRALRCDPAVPADVDGASLARFLTLNSVPAPHSLIKDVRKVPPGHIVRIRDDAAQEIRYWAPHLSPKPWRTSDCVEAVHEKFVAAVERRIPAEVDIGVFLSGGLDSALVAAVAAHRVGRVLPTFSASFPDDPSYDETEEVLSISRALGTEHAVVAMTKETLAAEIPTVLAGLDEPIADHSLIPTRILAGAARRRVKAVLTGDGADELMMGYRIFAGALLLRGVTRVVPPLVLRRLLMRAAGRKVSYQNLHYTHVAPLIARMVGTAPEHLYHVAAAAVPPGDWTTLLAPQWHAQARSTDVFADLDLLVAAHASLDTMEALQLGMLCHFLRDTILGKLDRATMLASLEARSPFLDAELVDTLLTVPSDLKLRFPIGKYILRRVAQRYLPMRLAFRRKRGFRVPIASLLRGHLKEYAQDMLSPHTVRRAALFRWEAVQTLLTEHLDGVADHHRALWSLLCAQAWALTGPRSATIPFQEVTTDDGRRAHGRQR